MTPTRNPYMKQSARKSFHVRASGPGDKGVTQRLEQAVGVVIVQKVIRIQAQRPAPAPTWFHHRKRRRWGRYRPVHRYRRPRRSSRARHRALCAIRRRKLDVATTPTTAGDAAHRLHRPSARFVAAPRADAEHALRASGHYRPPTRPDCRLLSWRHAPKERSLTSSRFERLRTRSDDSVRAIDLAPRLFC